VNVAQLLADVSAALGFEGAQPLTQGGQMLVLRGTLSGAPAGAKIIPIKPGPSGGVTLQRAHRKVELLSAVDSDRAVKVLTDAVEIGEPTEAVCVDEHVWSHTRAARHRHGHRDRGPHPRRERRGCTRGCRTSFQKVREGLRRLAQRPRARDEAVAGEAIGN
jgi:hypothetical protein